MTKEDKILQIIKRLKRGRYITLKKYQKALGKDWLKRSLLKSPMYCLTLCDVLEYLRKKFKFKSVTIQMQWVVGAWRFNHDDLRLQWGYCIDIVHYLVFTKIPKQTCQPKKVQSSSVENAGS